MIRVFIIAASPLARAGLENLLKTKTVEVVGTAACLESLSDVEVDIVLFDATDETPEQFAQSLADSGLSAEISAVVLADDWPATSLTTLLRAGVRALLPADIPADQLVAALQAAASGLVVLHPAEAEAVLPAHRLTSSPLAELAEPLTRREREVLQMLAAGLGNKEIAVRLSISEHTVKFHVASILGKLGAETRTEAVSLGIRRGLVML